jgi:tetratricopeptide (TPR) repeat protein
VEKTRRRLFVKTLLRRAKAYELEGDAEASVADLRVVLRVEPDSREAKQRLAILAHPPAPAAVDTPNVPGDALPKAVASAVKEGGVKEKSSSAVPATGSTDKAATKMEKGGKASDLLEDDDEDSNGPDFASTSALLNTAAEYIKKKDYSSALQVYNYARRSCKHWESALVELKAMSNTCLCLHRLRGRLPELVDVCNDVVEKIDELRKAPTGQHDVPEATLVTMELACLSRRGTAYAQLQKMEESARDNARVKELMEKTRELEK